MTQSTWKTGSCQCWTSDPGRGIRHSNECLPATEARTWWHTTSWALTLSFCVLCSLAVPLKSCCSASLGLAVLHTGIVLTAQAAQAVSLPLWLGMWTLKLLSLLLGAVAEQSWNQNCCMWEVLRVCSFSTTKQLLTNRHQLTPVLLLSSCWAFVYLLISFKLWWVSKTSSSQIAEKAVSDWYAAHKRARAHAHTHTQALSIKKGRYPALGIGWPGIWPWSSIRPWLPQVIS